MLCIQASISSILKSAMRSSEIQGCSIHEECSVVATTFNLPGMMPCVPHVALGLLPRMNVLTTRFKRSVLLGHYILEAFYARPLQHFVYELYACSANASVTSRAGTTAWAFCVKIGAPLPRADCSCCSASAQHLR